jgi:hypothetical protein
MLLYGGRRDGQHASRLATAVNAKGSLFPVGSD